jgi:hypothetical protein
VTADEKHAERIRRIQAERVAAGRPPQIESVAVYRLLAAVVDASSQHQHATVVKKS